MSFLARIAQRAAGPAASAPVLRPKGYGVGTVSRTPAGPFGLAREEADADPETRDHEAEFSAPAQRETESAADTPMAEEDAPETNPPAARRETTEAATWLDEAPEVPTTEGTVAHRAAAPDGEAPPDDASDARRTLRAIRPPPDDPTPRDDEPKPEATAAEPETGAARALRRDVVSGHQSAGAPATPGAPAQSVSPGYGDWADAGPSYATDPGMPDSGFAAPVQIPPHRDNASAGTAGFERPQVFIDQIDVLIHEPAPAAPARHDATARARSRFVDSRYLRRL